MSAFAAMGAVAEPVTVEFRGKHYPIQPLTVATLQRLERLMIQKDIEIRALALRVAVASRFITPDDAAHQLTTYTSGLVEGGKYAIGGKWFREMLESPDDNGAALSSKLDLFAIMMQCDVDTVVEMMATKGDELKMKIDMVMRGSLPPNAEGRPTEPPR